MLRTPCEMLVREPLGMRLRSRVVLERPEANDSGYACFAICFEYRCRCGV
jgi:hypothetical protein